MPVIFSCQIIRIPMDTINTTYLYVQCNVGRDDLTAVAIAGTVAGSAYRSVFSVCRHVYLY